MLYSLGDMTKLATQFKSTEYLTGIAMGRKRHIIHMVIYMDSFIHQMPYELWKRKEFIAYTFQCTHESITCADINWPFDKPNRLWFKTFKSPFEIREQTIFTSFDDAHKSNAVQSILRYTCFFCNSNATFLCIPKKKTHEAKKESINKNWMNFEAKTKMRFENGNVEQQQTFELNV